MGYGVDNKGFTNYGKNGNTSAYDVAKKNEWMAQSLANNYGAKIAAQLNSTPKITDPPTGGGSKSSGSGSNANLLGYLSNLYGNYASTRQSQLQAAYDNARNSINSGYDTAMGALGDNLASAKSALNSSYNNSLNKLRADASQSLREAYVNKMKSQKDMGQKMTALGLNGGATETSLASMLNNYGNARNNINTTLNSNIGDLSANRDQSLADIMANYSSQVASLAQQRANQLANLELQLANGNADALDQQFSFQTSSGYLDAVKNALANLGAYQGTPTTATNAVQTASTQQASPEQLAATTNYQNVLKYLEELMANA